MDEKIAKLKEIIWNSKSLVFFSGAGLSKESNIPDFRSQDGMVSALRNYGFEQEEILSKEFFFRHPDIFYRYYKDNLLHLNARPNEAHYALAELEREGILKCIITQNIDGLHQKAGSLNVIELHGSVQRNYCTRCDKLYGADYINFSDDIAYCEKCHNVIKPDIVLFDENLDSDNIRHTIQYISSADTLIIGGTNLSTYPVSSFINYFKGKNLVLINILTSDSDKAANLIVNDSVSRVLPKMLDY